MHFERDFNMCHLRSLGLIIIKKTVLPTAVGLS